MDFIVSFIVSIDHINKKLERYRYKSKTMDLWLWWSWKVNGRYRKNQQDRCQSNTCSHTDYWINDGVNDGNEKKRKKMKKACVYGCAWLSIQITDSLQRFNPVPITWTKWFYYVFEFCSFNYYYYYLSTNRPCIAILISYR